MNGRSAVRQQHAVFGRIPCHRHLAPYATVVLAGGYMEAGESGRWRIEQGMVVVHAAGEAHADWFGNRVTELFDFDLPRGVPAGVYRCVDADALARSARGERHRAISAPAPALDPVPREDDWPDLLAAELRRDPALAIGRWAADFGLRRETISRGFAQAYGVSPARYRLGIRIKGALDCLTTRTASLAEVALENGFADQSHMTRAVRTATGCTPGRLRKVTSVQERSCADL